MLVVDFVGADRQDDEDDRDDVDELERQPPPRQAANVQTEKRGGLRSGCGEERREDERDGEDVVDDKEELREEGGSVKGAADLECLARNSDERQAQRDDLQRRRRVDKVLGSLSTSPCVRSFFFFV